MRILNYGAGAVGLGIDSCLLKTGSELTVIGRPGTVSALKTQGLIRKGLFGDFQAKAGSFSCFDSITQIPKVKPFDFILVSTKSFDSETTANDLRKHAYLFNKQTKIILCQNGWGNAEIFASYLPKEQIYNARIITGFTRPKPNEVAITVHADSILIGSLFNPEVKTLEPLCQAITEGGIPCTTTLDIQADLWAKMLYNCALNPLGAIFEVPYGVLGSFENSRKLMNELIQEVFAAMQSAGYHTHWNTASDYLRSFYSKFVPSTADHNSSTLQDIKAKKKTEIDALNGVIVKLSERYEIPCPLNRTVYQMVKFLEEKNLTNPL